MLSFAKEYVEAYTTVPEFRDGCEFCDGGMVSLRLMLGVIL